MYICVTETLADETSILGHVDVLFSYFGQSKS